MDALIVPPVPRLMGWKFHRRLASTDFSEIWLVEDVALGRRAAAKIFAPKPDEHGMVPPFPVEEWRRRFIQEARIMARFDHPNIVPVMALTALADGRPCLLMQCMGGTLRREIGIDVFDPGQIGEMSPEDRPRAVRPGRTRQVLLDVLAALVEVHGQGLVHRDVKPRNLLLVDGPGSRVKLADFGMAKAPDEPRSKTAIWFGTRDYMSPEQYANTTLATDRSDVFSVGVIGIRMLTGRFPDRELLAAVPGLAPSFADLLCEALVRDPLRRPSARDMLRRLLALPP
ncbi:serine/threonine protein kinase [Paramagnetospirillum marisnigri]|uniref:Serine/threonine protein kinase n=1 Tax=Paramagnetospirillum marisnigri TaxID=1285242 RepID=A0A178M643_9PROT|nr:serine/threonine-protein kinase [Paramagnetospirillum marisnigri]OAN43015.1 serine/threonine protein kinase [Paramagnetospirillum marisnigri]